jgi:hypothetical protein
MYLSTADLFALMIALFGSVSVITLAFRRIVVLEQQARDYRRKIRKAGV